MNPPPPRHLIPRGDGWLHGWQLSVPMIFGQAADPEPRPICALRSAGDQIPADGKPRRNRDQTHRDGPDYVRRGTQPLAILHKRKGLQTERRERREAAADSGHQKRSCRRLRKKASTLRHRQSCEDSDQQRADRVHEKGPPGKPGPHPLHHPFGNPEPNHAPECSAERDPEIGRTHRRNSELAIAISALCSTQRSDPLLPRRARRSIP